MNNLLNYEGPVIKFISKIVYSVWLNILWFICSIPIFTIGPATIALFYCTNKMAIDEESYLTRSFFRAFLDNFKQGALVGIPATVIGVALGVDAYLLNHLHNTSRFWTLVFAVFIVASIAYILIISWMFPLLAHYENTIINTLKNAIVLSVRFILCSAMMLAVYFFMLVIVIRIFTPAIIFGMGTCAFINSTLLKNIFIMCEKSNGNNEE